MLSFAVWFLGYFLRVINLLEHDLFIRNICHRFTQGTVTLLFAFLFFLSTYASSDYNKGSMTLMARRSTQELIERIDTYHTHNGYIIDNPSARTVYTY